MSYNYTQPYSNWQTPSWMTDARESEIHFRVLDLLEELNLMEPIVYSDREFELANQMLENINVKT